MAAASLIAIGKTAAVSADIVVAVGTPVTVGIMATAGETLPQFSKLLINVKDSNGVYNAFAELNNEQRALTLSGPGTYQIQRETYINPGTSTGFGAYSA